MPVRLTGQFIVPVIGTRRAFHPDFSIIRLTPLNALYLIP